eukprot:COSAG06_NODE_6860_length_2741_cov_9.281226_2_plen_57_part_01
MTVIDRYRPFLAVFLPFLNFFGRFRLKRLLTKREKRKRRSEAEWLAPALGSTLSLKQ